MATMLVATISIILAGGERVPPSLRLEVDFVLPLSQEQEEQEQEEPLYDQN